MIFDKEEEGVGGGGAAAFDLTIGPLCSRRPREGPLEREEEEAKGGGGDADAADELEGGAGEGPLGPARSIGLELTAGPAERVEDLGVLPFFSNERTEEEEEEETEGGGGDAAEEVFGGGRRALCDGCNGFDGARDGDFMEDFSTASRPSSSPPRKSSDWEEDDEVS